MVEYERYYKRFKKTYHVQLQLESIVPKAKSLPDVSLAVDANFMAEVETLILTAGPDVEKLRAPIVIDTSRGREHKTQMDGTPRAIRSRDMIMPDAGGISRSVLYWPDARSPVSPHTSRV